jgi:hypothetical protein
MYEKDSKITCNKRINHYKFKNNISIDDFNNYKNDILKEFDKEVKFYAINDIRLINSIDIQYIKYLLDLNQIFTNKVINYIGCTIIITNNTNKSIYNIIMKMSNTQVPYYVATSLEDAIRYILLLK